MTTRHHRPERTLTAALLAAAALLATLPTTTTTATVAAAASVPAGAVSIQLALPPPTGPHPVGTTTLHLTDPTRPDLWAPTPRPRELKTQLWYPATTTAGHPAAPWATPAETAHLESDYLGAPAGRLTWPLTHGHQDAPADHTTRHPVVLYSPGSRGDRGFDTALAEELASRGYIVAAIDHTFDSGEVEFPGGRLEVRNTAAVHAMTDAGIVAYRAADTRLVLDRLTALAATGTSPDAGHRPPPPGLAAALDPATVGMFGHSMGGATTLQTLHDDPRVQAGASLDGPVFGAPATDGLTRPVLLMSSAWDSPARDAMWDTLWPELTGWRRQLNLTGSGHLSYTDFELLLPRARPAIAWTAADLDHFLGTGDGPHAITAQRAYLAAFFDLQLRHRPTVLFDGPSPRYPEIVLQR